MLPSSLDNLHMYAMKAFAHVCNEGMENGCLLFTLSREVAIADTSFSKLIKTSTHVGISKPKMRMEKKK